MLLELNAVLNPTYSFLCQIRDRFSCSILPKDIDVSGNNLSLNICSVVLLPVRSLPAVKTGLVNTHGDISPSTLTTQE
jgi:hypothetical protein